MLKEIQDNAEVITEVTNDFRPLLERGCFEVFSFVEENRDKDMNRVVSKLLYLGECYRPFKVRGGGC